MNIRKALQQIHTKSAEGADVTEDLASLIEALDLEEQIGKLTAKLEKAVTKFEAAATGRGRRRKASTEPAETATETAQA